MDLEMPGFWPSQPGDFKNQHLLPRQQVSKNHIIDGPPCTSSATGRNNQEPCTHTPRRRQPSQFAQTMASRQASTTATHHTPTSSSEVGHRGHLGIESAFARPTERQPLQLTPQAAPKRTTPDVVLKRSTTTTSAYKPGERW